MLCNGYFIEIRIALRPVLYSARPFLATFSSVRPDHAALSFVRPFHAGFRHVLYSIHGTARHPLLGVARTLQRRSSLSLTRSLASIDDDSGFYYHIM
ncbi:hypothetical protein HanIR_Chr09g0442251 [Helianthus annuus]|nr:hypothetical protein HanIR_Chr09g0442251 [Helianthus annuus]KAJ0544128.1 hypothetical protein HanHA89_Chr09g0358161 [Helianthus annuus]